MNRPTRAIRPAAATAAVAAGLCFRAFAGAEPASRPATRPASGPVPVVLDTDIGDDIDDAWALTLVLKDPRLDLRLVTTTNGRQAYRADLIAKLLAAAGRTDVPIGLGAGTLAGDGPGAGCLRQGDRGTYAGRVDRDGVGAMLDVLRRSPVPVTVIAIGPMQTVAAAVARDPSAVARADLVGMQGSVRRGYDGSRAAVAEFNVKADPTAARRALSAAWRSVTVTPLDTCGLPDVGVDGPAFAELVRSRDPLVVGLLDENDAWRAGSHLRPGPSASTRLYDAVAVALADPADRRLLTTERLSLAVRPDGTTVVDPAAGHPTDVATGWADLPGFREMLGRRLAGGTVRPPTP